MEEVGTRMTDGGPASLRAALSALGGLPCAGFAQGSARVDNLLAVAGAAGAGQRSKWCDLQRAQCLPGGGPRQDRAAAGCISGTSGRS